MLNSKFNSFTEWRLNDRKAYRYALILGIIPNICETFGWKTPIEHKPSNYWTLEKCIEEALKYKNRSKWNKLSSGSYKVARKNDWLDECCAHMVQNKKPSNYWTLEKCIEEALKYKNRGDWNKYSAVSYGAARKNKWMNECCAHMIRVSKPKGYWDDKENCLNEALKYNSINEWVKKCKSTYSTINKKEYFEECIKHMDKPKNKPSGFWTKENCMKDALKYKTKTEWRKSGSSGYQVTLRNGWYVESTKHMVSHKKLIQNS
jgi:hypothetical protein